MRFPEWSVAYSDPAEGVNCFWIMNGSMVIGSVDGPQSDVRQEQRAHLIAAAPNLHSALSSIVATVDPASMPEGLYADAVEALAKAMASPSMIEQTSDELLEG